jgi:hypothetical protein
MVIPHATALFFLEEDSQNLYWQKAVRVARPPLKHVLQVGGCLVMATTAIFDEYYKA